jgi:hypothetical protein
MGMSGMNIQKAVLETDRKVTEQVSKCVYLGNTVSELIKYTDIMLQRNNKNIVTVKTVY